MNDLSNKILERINEEQVAPRPRWQFAWKNRIYWGLWAISLALASAASSAILFSLANSGWEFSELTHDGTASFLLSVLPTAWIVVMGVVLFLAYENYRQTKHGYRIPFMVAVGLSLLGALAGGVVLYLAGIGQLVDEDFGGRFPAYKTVMARQQSSWVHPERGLLAGEVLDVDGDFRSFRVQSFDGTIWILGGEDLTPKSRELLLKHKLVRVVGFMVDDGKGNLVFKPCFVFPWEIKGGVQDRLVSVRMPLRSESPPIPVLPFERKIDAVRNTDCKGVRPYDYLRRLQDGQR